MRIAIVGHRGIPGNYGGFETFAEELSARLVDRGHTVVNYCRSTNWDYRDLREYRGSELRVLPTLRVKQFDTIVHTALSALHLLTHPVDAVLMVNPGNASLSWIPRLRGTPVAVHAMHPGWADTASVRTSLPRFHRVTEAILRTPAEGADTVVWLAASPAARELQGAFVFDREARRTHLLPGTPEDAEERRRFLERCDEVVGRA